MTAPRRALVLIDIQGEYFEGPLAIQHPPREVSLANALRALAAAEAAGIPVLVVQHEYPAGASAFAVGSAGWRLHPELEARIPAGSRRVVKDRASVFTAEGVVEWLRDLGVDTVALVGYMTNNCVLGTAAGAEPLGFSVEVLADATGAIHLVNDAGSIPARQVHETLLALLHANWAAVADTDAWIAAVSAGAMLPRGDLGSSALRGRERY